MSLRRFSGVGVLIGGSLLLACLATALLVAQPGHAAGTEQGPVAEYSFDEGTGTTVADVSGHGHTATIEGAKWARGRYGGGLEFKGSEHNVVKIPASSELNFEEEFTLEAWVRPTSSTDKLAPILGKTTGGGSGSKSLSYYLYAGNSESKPYGEIQHVLGTGKKATASSAPPGSTWTHLALTYDGAEERLYVNGLQVAETASEAPVTTTGELQIGAETEHSEYFTGRIDEVRIYNRALNGGEVGADMEAPIETPKSGPVASYSFDEGVAGVTTVEDTSGHEHTATIEGAKWARGRYGGGLEFKGSEHNVVKIPASSELNFEEEFTLEAWVRPASSTDKLAPIVGKTTGGGSGSKSLSYYLYAGNSESKPYGEIQHVLGTGKKATASSAPPGSTWTHLALTYDGAKERLYVNGALVAETASEAPVTTTGELQIGAETEHSEYFTGRIDEVRIYNRALNGGEVGADMEAPLITPKQGPVAAYSFDEGVAGVTTVEDVTGDGHTATIEDGEWTKGKYGGGIGFDGGGGSKCVSVPDSPELRFSEEFTLEAWVRPEGGVYEDPVVVRESSGKDAFGLGLGSREEGEAEGFIGEGKGSKAAVGGEEIREYEWVHLAATWDGSKIRLYVDDELADTETATSPPATGEGSLKIGCDGPDGQFTGQIDEVRAYNRTLDGAEVAADMETPLQTPKVTPVAAYSFDEKNEENATDTTGDGHTATVEGAKWTSHGHYGGAMEFDAAEEDVLKIPASPQLNLGEEFTLEAWVRPSGADNHSAPLIDKQEGSAHGYFLYEGGSVSDRPYGAANEEQELIHAEEPLAANAWSHVALVFTGNRTWLYVNGEPVDNGAAEPTITSEGELEIGGSTDTGDWFDGRIDEVRIYNRGLDAAEVDADMEAPIQTPKQGPIAAWSFEEGEGSTVEDVTGDGHTGTIEGAKWARGKYGEGLKFNGAGNVVKVPNSPEFDLTEGFTLESWVRPESASNKWAPILAKEMGGGKAAHELAWWLYEGGSESNVPFGGIEPAPAEREEAVAEDPLPVNAWSHVALTYDGAQVRLYVDGELVDYSTVPAGSPPVTEGELQIGAATEHGDHFVGRIDEVRIYNRALSPAEIAASMRPLPKVTSGETYGVDDEDVILTGTVDAMGLETSVSYEYGPTTAYGSVYPSSPEEIEEWHYGNQPEGVSQVIDELEPETTYHYRVLATNANGTVVGHDRTVTTSPAEFEAAIAPKEFSGFVGVGWSGNPNTYTSNTAMGYVAESGSKMFRVVISPGHGKVQEEHLRERNDNLFKFMAEHNIKILPNVSGIPGQPSNQLPSIAAGSPFRERWEKGLKGLVERYGPEGKFWEQHPKLEGSLAPVYWEIWNEENEERNADAPEPGVAGGTIDPARYGTLLEISHNVLEEVNATTKTNARVMFGGLLTGPSSHLEPPNAHMPVGEYVKAVAHAGDYAALSLHPYAFKGTVTKVARKVRNNIYEARKALDETGGGSKKVWVTEIGWPVNSAPTEGGLEKDNVHPAISEALQAERLTAVFDRIKSISGTGAKEMNVGSILWYNIQDYTDNNLNHKEWAAHCGLVLQNGNHRSSFGAFHKETE